MLLEVECSGAPDLRAAQTARVLLTHPSIVAPFLSLFARLYFPARLETPHARGRPASSLSGNKSSSLCERRADNCIRPVSVLSRWRSPSLAPTCSRRPSTVCAAAAFCCAQLHLCIACYLDILGVSPLVSSPAQGATRTGAASPPPQGTRVSPSTRRVNAPGRTHVSTNQPTPTPPLPYRCPSSWTPFGIPLLVPLDSTLPPCFCRSRTSPTH